MSRAFESRALNNTQKDELLDLLVNFKYDLSYGDKVDASVAFCYTPRNAIVFLDKHDKPIGYVEICFECKRFEYEPRELTVGLFCTEKFELVKDLFSRAGVRYGASYIEERPEFPGGFAAMKAYISNHLERPKLNPDVEGAVWVKFFVNEDGSLSDVSIKRGLCEKCDVKAINLVKGMPKWKPAISINEKPVKSEMIIPIRFN